MHSGHRGARPWQPCIAICAPAGDDALWFRSGAGLVRLGPDGRASVRGALPERSGLSVIVRGPQAFVSARFSETETREFYGVDVEGPPRVTRLSEALAQPGALIQWSSNAIDARGRLLALTDGEVRAFSAEGHSEIVFEAPDRRQLRHLHVWDGRWAAAPADGPPVVWVEGPASPRRIALPDALGVSSLFWHSDRYLRAWTPAKRHFVDVVNATVHRPPGRIWSVRAEFDAGRFVVEGGAGFALWTLATGAIDRLDTTPSFPSSAELVRDP